MEVVMCVDSHIEDCYEEAMGEVIGATGGGSRL